MLASKNFCEKKIILVTLNNKISFLCTIKIIKYS